MTSLHAQGIQMDFGTRFKIKIKSNSNSNIINSAKEENFNSPRRWLVFCHCCEINSNSKGHKYIDSHKIR